jgi:RNA polymerase sigma factor (sigma-70 family)
MMTPDKTQPAWRSLDTLLTIGTLGTLTDGQLLDCFRDRRDRAGQEAFRLLVQRHGPMVLDVCRRLIRDTHEAEDAFQATFLVLVRKSESIRRRDTIAPWLYGVAGRVARRARFRSNRRRRREVAVVVEVPVEDQPGLQLPTAEHAVHEEIARLPDSLRAPIVLCCLQGLSYDLAARRLGVSESTLRGRLHRARKRLDARLQGRGIGAPIAASAIDSRGVLLPALPSSLVETTIQIASRWSSLSGLLVGGSAVPESVVALAQGVIRTMFFQTLKITGIGVLVAVGAVGTVVLAQQGYGRARQPAVPSAAAPVGTPSNQAAVPATPAQDRRLEEKTRQIELILDLPIPMSFPNETPLNDVLKYIKRATTTPTFPGIPIYINPPGLKEAGKTIQSTVLIDRQDVPLKESLREVLQQVGMAYLVKDGFLMIDSRMSIMERRVEDLDRKLDKVLGVLARLERAK